MIYSCIYEVLGLWKLLNMVCDFFQGGFLAFEQRDFKEYSMLIPKFAKKLKIEPP